MQDVSLNAEPNGMAKLIESQKLGTHLVKGGLENASLAPTDKNERPADLPEITGKGKIVDTQA